jgi:hypothetical protein
MAFNVKKLLNDGKDLTLWQRGKNKQCKRSGWQILQIYAADGQFSLANMSMLTSIKSFSNSMWTPGSRGHFLAKIHLLADLAPIYIARSTLAVVGRILVSGRSAAICARLDFARLLYLLHFEGQSPGNASRQFGHSMPIHCHGMGLASGRIHHQNLLLIPLPLVSHANKNYVFE